MGAKPRIRDELRGHDVVHITCHGIFDEQNPLRSGLLLSDGRSRPPRNPSYLERARYVLTVRDLMDLRTDASLVTLRACSSGALSAHHAGDEFEGLTRALLDAGSATVLASLWNVDQRSSLDLLRRFYANWRSADETIPKWQALQQAQAWLLNADSEPFLRHPYHWAPFVLIGDWR